MLKHLREFGFYVKIAGFRNVRILDTDCFLRKIRQQKPLSVEVQFFDAGLTATWQHLYFAALNALTVFENKTNVTKSLAMETLVFAAAEQQITKAMELFGIKPCSQEVAALAFGKSPDKTNSTFSMIAKEIGGHQDDSVLELSREKVAMIKKIFHISTEELETITKTHNGKKALVDLVIERIALSATRR